MMRLFAAFAAVALLSACGSSPEYVEDEEMSEDAASDTIDDVDAAADAAVASAMGGLDDDAGSEEVKGGETYPEYDARRDSYQGSRGTYAGYGCTQDCGGHDAGYQWAESRDITDPDDCGGKSWSFEEGCRAYAEEQKSSGDDGSDY